MEETNVKKDEKSVADTLKEELFFKGKNAFEEMNEEETEKCFEYAKGYAKFLDNGKTERECVKTAVALLEEKGFIPFEFGMQVNAGEKY